MTRRIDYGRLMHKAMCALISEVLADAAENGLPGDHHFVITFDVTHPGVDMSDRVRENYPKEGELTIILRNYFENLAVMPDRFAVTLSFGNQAEALVVPFDALMTFIDPSVEFGLRFDSQDDPGPGSDPEAPDEDTASTPDTKPGEVVSLDRFRKT